VSTAEDAETRNHWWWRPGWRQGRSFYTWHIIFDDQQAIGQLISHYQSALAEVPVLDLIPVDWLHLTVQGVGFSDQVSAGDLAAVRNATAVRLASIAPVTVTIGRARTSVEGVHMSVYPPDSITAIRDGIRYAIGEVWGADHVPESNLGFTPHISLAYANTSGAPLAPIRAILDQRHPKAMTIATIRKVSLLDINRDHRMYQWSLIGSAFLGG
jgi:hypothetical protein